MLEDTIKKTIKASKAYSEVHASNLTPKTITLFLEEIAPQLKAVYGFTISLEGDKYDGYSLIDSDGFSQSIGFHKTPIKAILGSNLLRWFLGGESSFKQAPF